MKNIYVALENVRSVYNVGAIFRTCSFFGVYDVILVGYSGKDFNTLNKPVLHEKVTKTALGSEEDLNITFFENSGELIEFARGGGSDVVAVEQNEKSTPLEDWKPKDNSILVFGNEVDGVSEEILAKANGVIEISHHGKHGSLNVTTACGVVLHQLSRND